MQNTKLQFKIQNFKIPSSKFQVPSSNHGFTLLETLIALAILTTGIAASLTLVGQSLKSISYFQNQTTALYLTTEGIEFVRNRRDENFIGGANWLANLDDCRTADGCFVDVKNNIINQCPSADCPFINYDSDTNLYYYSSCNPPNCQATIFKRKIKITDIPGTADEKKLISEITWQERYGPQNFTLEEHIFKWR